MKKNLRIVSAAAAALLAVAPVAASAVSTVSAADTTATTPAVTNGSYTNINLNGTTVTNNENQVDVTPSLTLTGKNGNIKGNLTGTISASFGGQSYTGNLTSENGKNNVTITGTDGKEVSAADLVPGTSYNITVSNLGFNFGSVNHGKKITLVSSNKNVTFAASADNKAISVSADGKTATVTLDQNGTVQGLSVKTTATAFDPANTNDVVFYNIANGQPATTGNIDVVANANGQLNTTALVAAVQSSYVAVQKNVASATDTTNGGRGDELTLNTVANKKLNVATAASDIADQLKAEGITVDANGNFNAKHSFTFNYEVVSTVNGKTGKLPVTVTVANVAEPTVDSVSKRIMHNAYYYDKDAKRVGTDSAKRYESVSVLPNTTTINGKTYYQVVENGKAVDKYINAANIDGTKRTLKHNAYVYASSKKRANKVVLKKGEVVTTYGASYTFKNGQKYYKIGDNTDKTYVKVANFR